MAGIYKAYDVRGEYPHEINEDLARRLGRAMATYLGGGTVAVGYDMRPRSPGLAEAFARSLAEGGVSTIEVGLVTTPTLYYVVGSRALAGGVMVTASHNPAKDNGFKLCREGVRPIGSTSGLRALEQLERLYRGELPPPADEPGTRTRLQMQTHYVNHVLRLAGPVGALKVAFDCGNGAVGPTLERVLRCWPGIEAVRLYFEPDGTFPNHPADPLTPRNLRDLQEAVVREGCDLGVAFDGDGDRCVFVDEQGQMVPPDLVTVLLARETLAREPGGTVVYDVPSSIVVRDEILAAGGVPVEERVGHSFMKATLRRTNAAFGGESSGHYYFRDHWFADSALIAAGRVLSLLCREGRALSEVAAPLLRMSNSGLRNFSPANGQVPDKDAALERLGQAFTGGQVSRRDGVKVELNGWWFLARKSNTENKIRVAVEAGSPQQCEDGLRQVAARLAESGFAPD